MSQQDDPQCTGPFSDARDCPIHDPRKLAPTGPQEPRDPLTLWKYGLRDDDAPKAESPEPPREPLDLLPKRNSEELISALRQRAGMISGASWERQANADMMNEAATEIERLRAGAENSEKR